MKVKKLYAYALMVLFVLATCTISSCGSENDEPTPTPKEEPKGEVDYVINNGNGGGSVTDPIVVTKGEPLDMTISQKSSYTDSDGKVFTCEPKATISLKIAIDTVHVKDLATLMSVKQKGNPSTSTSGTNPVQTKMAQTFEIDGKTISSFDLGYEIYRYTNAANQTIEMPYIKLSPAAYGSVKTDQTTRGLAAVTGIRLTPIEPLATTRSVLIKDTTMYKVNVSFNVDMQSQNTEKGETTPIVFEAEFIGMVENTTELPDPATTFSYQLNILGGTESKASPFVVTLGENFSLEWEQTSQYTYFSATELDGKTVGERPKATVMMNVAKDTLMVSSLEELEKVTEAEPVEATNGDGPTKYTTQQSFNIGGKIINVDWNYEAYAPEMIDGKKVDLPYLKLDKVKVVSVSKTELSNEGNTAKIYEVTVKLSQNLLGVNTPETVSETVEYIVKYPAAIEVKLIGTVYEKGYKWVEAHDNLPWMSYYQVYRTRTYSTGEIETDTFTYPYGHMAAATASAYGRFVAGTSDQDYEYRFDDGTCFLYHKGIPDSQNDNFIKIFYYKTGVYDLGKIIADGFDTVTDTWNSRGDLSDYTSPIYGYQEKPLHYNPENPIEGWYSKRISMIESGIIIYPSHGTLKQYDAEALFYDCILYLDNQLIDFSDYRMTYNFDFREENTTLTDGTPAKVFTHECKAKYLGKDFYGAAIDTVYQMK